MSDQSEIDAGWDDLLGDVDDASAKQAATPKAPAAAPAVPRVGAAVTVPTVDPPKPSPKVPRLGSTPDAKAEATPAVPTFTPPSAKGKDGLLTPPPSVAKSSDYTKLRTLGDIPGAAKPAASGPAASLVPELEAGASLLPPPPEYTPPASTAEVPVEVRAGLDPDEEEEPDSVDGPPVDAEPEATPSASTDEGEGDDDEVAIDVQDSTSQGAKDPSLSDVLPMADASATALPQSAEAADASAVDLPATSSLASNESSDDLEIDVEASGHALYRPLANPEALGSPAESSEDLDIDLEASNAGLSPVEGGAQAWSSAARISAPAEELLHSRAATGPNESVPVRPRRSAPFAAITPQPGRSNTMWIGLGAGVVAVLGLFLWMGSGDDEGKDGKETVAAIAKDDGEAADDGKAAADDATPVADGGEAAADGGEAAADDGEAAAHDGEAAAHDGEAAADDGEAAADDGEAAADDGEAAADDSPRVATSSAEYDAAAAEYEESGSAEALLRMTTAACSIGEGPDAREAFRKLKGSDLRSTAMVHCQEAEIDLTAKVDGYTADELLGKAEQAFEAGRYNEAINHARASNKVERNSDAMLVAAKAACHKKDAEEAQRLRRHVSKRSRDELAETCEAKGITLEDDD